MVDILYNGMLCISFPNSAVSDIMQVAKLIYILLVFENCCLNEQIIHSYHQQMTNEVSQPLRHF